MQYLNHVTPLVNSLSGPVADDVANQIHLIWPPSSVSKSCCPGIGSVINCGGVAPAVISSSSSSSTSDFLCQVCKLICVQSKYSLSVASQYRVSGLTDIVYWVFLGHKMLDQHFGGWVSSGYTFDTWRHYPLLLFWRTVTFTVHLMCNYWEGAVVYRHKKESLSDVLIA